MIQNNDLDVSEFIKISNAGVTVATFVQIREALIRRYKAAYGDDIDLSTATADGVFIYDLSLIMNNILQSFKNITNNLDINIASGKYLDNLCALANIQRKKATKSRVSINITNNGSTSSDSFNIKGLQVVDSSTKTWSNTTAIPSIDAGKTISIMFECDSLGQVEAPANSIYQTVDGSYPYLIISQPNDAIVGELEESDSDLRDRRSQSAGADGTTVLDSLVGSLLEVSKIRDVYIYNNTNEVNKSMPDGTMVPLHGIYIVIRYEEGIEFEKNSDGKIKDDTTGEIILNKITPGISTTPTADTTSGENISCEIDQTFLGTKIDLSTLEFNWKKAIPVKPTITISLTKYDNWSDSEETAVKESLINYLNSLSLSTDLYEQQLEVKIAQMDPLLLGKPTYRVDKITIDGSSNRIYTNRNTYYNYSANNIIIQDTTSSN